MRFSVLKAGTAPRGMRQRLGDYGEMFIRLLAEPGQQWAVHDVEHGEFPERVEAYDGFVITGGAASAYDDEPWLRRLEALAAEAHRREAPLLGICLGAQVAARALGGEAALNPEGWELGVARLALTAGGRTTEPLASGPQPLHILETHRDIVTVLPPGAQHLAGSRRTPYEIFTVGRAVLCLQGHPEMDREGVRELIVKRRDRGLLDPDRAEEALASLEAEPHRAFLQRWLRAFLREGGLPRAA